MRQVVTMTDRRSALAKRLGLTAPAGEANTNGTVAAAEGSAAGEGSGPSHFVEPQY
jgi:hypothetical protein